MLINTAEFLQSNVTYLKCPAPIHPEFAFIGRSNVGKSSLINMITGRNNLALTSRTPGKTQTINHFLINRNLYIADLPGYGYAKVSKKDRKDWERMIRDYLLLRPNLVSTFVLADIRHEPQKHDLDFMHWLGTSELPFIIAFTKADKLTKNELSRSFENYMKVLNATWAELPPYIMTSSSLNLGREDILDYLEKNAKLFNDQRK